MLIAIQNVNYPPSHWDPNNQQYYGKCLEAKVTDKREVIFFVGFLVVKFRCVLLYTFIILLLNYLYTLPDSKNIEERANKDLADSPEHIILNSPGLNSRLERL